jgi:large subunit ribosomal protein L23Ae
VQNSSPTDLILGNFGTAGGNNNDVRKTNQANETRSKVRYLFAPYSLVIYLTISIDDKAKAKAKAESGKKAVLKGTHSKKIKKVRTSTTFSRPKTLKLARKPKYQRKAIHSEPRLDAYAIIRHPLNSESAMKKIEEHNTLVFVVDVKASKSQIKNAIKKLYSVSVLNVNTLVRYVPFLSLVHC